VYKELTLEEAQNAFQRKLDIKIDAIYGKLDIKDRCDFY
jgi:hypothetical protein